MHSSLSAYSNLTIVDIVLANLGVGLLNNRQENGKITVPQREHGAVAGYQLCCAINVLDKWYEHAVAIFYKCRQLSAAVPEKLT